MASKGQKGGQDRPGHSANQDDQKSENGDDERIAMIVPEQEGNAEEFAEQETEEALCKKDLAEMGEGVVTPALVRSLSINSAASSERSATSSRRIRQSARQRISPDGAKKGSKVSAADASIKEDTSASSARKRSKESPASESSPNLVKLPKGCKFPEFFRYGYKEKEVVIHVANRSTTGFCHDPKKRDWKWFGHGTGFAVGDLVCELTDNIIGKIVAIVKIKGEIGEFAQIHWRDNNRNNKIYGNCYYTFDCLRRAQSNPRIVSPDYIIQTEPDGTSRTGRPQRHQHKVLHFKNGWSDAECGGISPGEVVRFENQTYRVTSVDFSSLCIWAVPCDEYGDILKIKCAREPERYFDSQDSSALFYEKLDAKSEHSEMQRKLVAINETPGRQGRKYKIHDTPAKTDDGLTPEDPEPDTTTPPAPIVSSQKASSVNSANVQKNEPPKLPSKRSVQQQKVVKSKVKSPGKQSKERALATAWNKLQREQGRGPTPRRSRGGANVDSPSPLKEVALQRASSQTGEKIANDKKKTDALAASVVRPSAKRSHTSPANEPNANETDIKRQKVSSVLPETLSPKQQSSAVSSPGFTPQKVSSSSSGESQSLTARPESELVNGSFLDLYRRLSLVEKSNADLTRQAAELSAQIQTIGTSSESVENRTRDLLNNYSQALEHYKHFLEICHSSLANLQNQSRPPPLPPASTLLPQLPSGLSQSQLQGVGGSHFVSPQSPFYYPHGSGNQSQALQPPGLLSLQQFLYPLGQQPMIGPMLQAAPMPLSSSATAIDRPIPGAHEAAPAEQKRDVQNLQPNLEAVLAMHDHEEEVATTNHADQNLCLVSSRTNVYSPSGSITTTEVSQKMVPLSEAYSSAVIEEVIDEEPAQIDVDELGDEPTSTPVFRQPTIPVPRIPLPLLSEEKIRRKFGAKTGQRKSEEKDFQERMLYSHERQTTAQLEQIHKEEMISMVEANQDQDFIYMKFFNKKVGYAAYISQPVRAGRYLCEYRGDLVSADEGEKRDELYAEQGKTERCFTYYFNAVDQQTKRPQSLCLDADIAGQGTMGRILNHDRIGPSCKPIVVYTKDGDAHLVFLARHDLVARTMLTYDYKDRRRLKDFSWLTDNVSLTAFLDLPGEIERFNALYGNAESGDQQQVPAASDKYPVDGIANKQRSLTKPNTPTPVSQDVKPAQPTLPHSRNRQQGEPQTKQTTAPKRKQDERVQYAYVQTTKGPMKIKLESKNISVVEPNAPNVPCINLVSPTESRSNHKQKVAQKEQTAQSTQEADSGTATMGYPPLDQYIDDNRVPLELTIIAYRALREAHPEKLHITDDEAKDIMDRSKKLPGKRDDFSKQVWSFHQMMKLVLKKLIPEYTLEDDDGNRIPNTALFSNSLTRSMQYLRAASSTGVVLRHKLASRHILYVAEAVYHLTRPGNGFTPLEDGQPGILAMVLNSRDNFNRRIWELKQKAGLVGGTKTPGAKASKVSAPPAKTTATLSSLDASSVSPQPYDDDEYIWDGEDSQDQPNHDEPREDVQGNVDDVGEDDSDGSSYGNDDEVTLDPEDENEANELLE